jgi:hypothetical protein
MNLENIVCRNEEKFMISNLGDEVVLMDIQQGHYININPVGSAIWNKLSTPLAVKDLITSLVDEYGISTNQCESDTLKFLQKLQQHHMLNVQ